MKHIPLAPLAVAAVLLVGVACADDAGDDRAVVESRTADEPSGDATTTTEAIDTGTGSGAGDASGTDAGDAGDDEGTAEETAGNEVPEDRALDIELRHPSGVTLSLSRMAFESGDVMLDAEVVNSSRSEIVFHFGNVTGERLRLVDDAGTEYNFIEPAEDEDVIKIAAGESLNGTLAFRGPLSGQPDELRLVTNVYPDDVDGFDMSQESDSEYSPGFVVPLPLTWA
jgi:hypothetical protein